MKKIVLLFLLLVIAVFITGCATKSTELSKQDTTTGEKPEQKQPETISIPEAKEHIIEINNFAFSPSEIRIKKGDKVVWDNMDSVEHTITSDSGNELKSDLLSKGERYSHTFDKIGIFSYHCSPHSYMKGKIIVE